MRNATAGVVMLARVIAGHPLHNRGVSRRGVAVWGAGGTVVLAALSGALINELHQGWPWWLAAGAVVLTSAALSAWLTLRVPSDHQGDQLAGAAVKAGRDIQGRVTTHADGPAASSGGPSPAEGDQLGPGAVKAGRDIGGDVTTNVGTTPPQPPTS